MPDATTKVHLLVGFGGSGLKTLHSLARLISGDGELKDRLPRQAAFLLVDTDERDLAEYAGDPRRGLRGKIPELLMLGEDDTNGPIIEVFQPSRGVNVMAEWVSETFRRTRRRNGDDGMETLGDHWWFKAPDSKGNPQPFTAHMLRTSPVHGAGALPLVSQFLAWSRAEEIQQVVTEIVQKLEERVSGPFDLEAHFVAGLAGGTGRGCWTTLAFAVRDALRRANRSGQPVAHLFDATIFPTDDLTRETGEATKRRVNSLSGISELVMWMRNELSEGESQHFALPSLHKPLEASHHVIDTRRLKPYDTDTLGRSPCRVPYIYFGDSPNGRLPSASDYYDMAGGCLYALVADSDILAKGINRSYAPSQMFESAGCNRIEVPIGAMRDALAALLKWQWLDRMAGDAAHGDLDRSVKNFHRAVDIDPARFPNIEMSSGRESGPDPDLTRRLWSTIAEEIDTSPLEGDLRAGKVEAAKRSCRIDLSERAIRRAVQQAFTDINGGRDPVAILKTAVREKLSANDEGVNLTRALQILEECKGGIQQEIKDLEKAPSPGGGGSKSKSAFPDPKQAIIARKGKTALVFGRRFTDKEIREIVAIVRRFTLKSNYDRIRKEVLRELGAYLDRVQTAIDRLDETIAGLRLVGEEVEKIVFKAFPSIRRKREGASGITYEDACFADPENLASIAREKRTRTFDASRHFKTELIPPMSVPDLDELCDRIRQNTDLKYKLIEAVGWIKSDTVLDLEGTSTRTPRSLAKTVAREIGDMLGHTSIPPAISEEEFNLRRVLERIRTCFEEQFDRFKDNDRKRDGLQRTFEAIFNTTVKRNSRNNTVDLPDLEEMVSGLVIRLADRCDPYARTRLSPTDRRVDFASVVVPRNLWRGLAKRIENDPRLAKAGLKSDAVTFPKRTNDQPYLMLAHVQMAYSIPFDHDPAVRRDAPKAEEEPRELASIDYWKDDAELRDAMEHMENAVSPLVFASKTRLSGLGYLNPTFVADEYWSGLRWRPWYDESSARVREADRIHVVSDAILYLILGTLETGETIPDNVLTQCRESGEGELAEPLLEISETGGKLGYRRAPVVEHRIGQSMRRGPGDAIAAADLKRREGIVAFRNRLEQSNDLLEEVGRERAIFDTVFSERNGRRGKGPEENVAILRTTLFERIDHCFKKARGADAREVWRALRDRSKAFRIGVE